MLDVYKNWKRDYDKKLGDYLIKQFNGVNYNNSNETEVNKKLKERDNEDIDENSCKKQKTGEETDTVKIVCLPIKFIK